jgi:hypothetical protein
MRWALPIHARIAVGRTLAVPMEAVFAPVGDDQLPTVDSFVSLQRPGIPPRGSNTILPGISISTVWTSQVRTYFNVYTPCPGPKCKTQYLLFPLPEKSTWSVKFAPRCIGMLHGKKSAGGAAKFCSGVRGGMGACDVTAVTPHSQIGGGARLTANDAIFKTL